MFIILSAILSLCLTVYGDECVTNNFEGDLENFFANTRSCSSLPLWRVGSYNSTSIIAPHENSVSFISPNPTSSCVSSSPFKMNLDGTLEVNVLMDSADLSDQLMVLVQVVNEGGTDLVIARGELASADGTLVSTNGFQPLHIVSTGLPLLGEFEAYLVFIGTAAEQSTAVIDSYRYLPPEFKEELCPLYEDAELTTTTVFTTEEMSPIATNSSTIEQATTTLITTIFTIEETTLIVNTDSTITDSTAYNTTEVEIEEVITLSTQVLSTVTEDGSDVTNTESTFSTTHETDQALPTETVTTLTENSSVVTASTLLTTLETDEVWPTEVIKVTTEDSSQEFITITNGASEITVSDNTVYTTDESDEILSTLVITEDGGEAIGTTLFTTSGIDEILPTGEINATTTSTAVPITISTLETTSETPNLPIIDVDTTTHIEETEEDITDIAITTQNDRVTTQWFTSTTIDLAVETTTNFGTVDTITPSTVENDTVDLETTTTYNTTESTTEVPVTEKFTSSANVTTEENIGDTVTFVEESSVITVTESSIIITEENEATISTIIGDVPLTTIGTSTNYVIEGEISTSPFIPSTTETMNSSTENDSTRTESTISINTDGNEDDISVTEDQYTMEYVTGESTITDLYITDEIESQPIFTGHTIPEVTETYYEESTGNDTGSGFTDDYGIESTPLATVYPNSTERPIEPPRRSFWNPLTITTVVMLSCIALALLFWCFYACGYRIARSNRPNLLVNNYSNLPNSTVMPRAKRSHATSLTKNWLDKYYV